MPYTQISLARLLKVFDISIPRDIINNCDWLYGQLGSLPATVQNGSFEVDSDGDGQPDNIIITTSPGGQVLLDAATQAEGSKCLKFVHPGGANAGGGTAELDYVPCSELARIIVSWIHWATAAGMHNQVRIRFFDHDRVEVPGSTAILYTSTNNPTAIIGSDASHCSRS